MTTQNLRKMIAKGYRPVECPSVSNKRDADGRPVVICILKVPSRKGSR